MEAPALINPPGVMKRPRATTRPMVRNGGGTPRPGALWVRRVGWLVLIWVASVAALGVVALVFRAVMSLAGMTP